MVKLSLVDIQAKIQNETLANYTLITKEQSSTLKQKARTIWFYHNMVNKDLQFKFNFLGTAQNGIHQPIASILDLNCKSNKTQK